MPSAPFLINLKERNNTMEALVFAIVALRKGYKLEEITVPEPEEFRPFDVRALKHSYQLEADSSNRPSGRQNSLVTQTAS
jgi:hypothetical protein